MIPSLVGALAFMMPVPDKGTFNTALGLLIDWGKGDPKAYLPTAALTAVVLSAAASLFAVLARPRSIMENTFLRELLCVSPFWLASRVLGAVLTVFLLPPFAWYSCM